MYGSSSILYRGQRTGTEQQGQSIEDRDSGQSSKGRAASFQWIVGRAARTEQQVFSGQTNRD